MCNSRLAYEVGMQITNSRWQNIYAKTYSLWQLRRRQRPIPSRREPNHPRTKPQHTLGNAICLTSLWLRERNRPRNWRKSNRILLFSPVLHKTWNASRDMFVCCVCVCLGGDHTRTHGGLGVEIKRKPTFHQATSRAVTSIVSYTIEQKSGMRRCISVSKTHQLRMCGAPVWNIFFCTILEIKLIFTGNNILWSFWQFSRRFEKNDKLCSVLTFDIIVLHTNVWMTTI